MTKTKTKKPTVEEIIYKAVIAQRIASERQPQDTFKTTEKRLYAYPVIKLKIADDRGKIEDIHDYGAPTKSKSITRFQRSGVRIGTDDIAEAIIINTTADIAENELEIETIDKALSIIADDPYANIIKYKYFEEKNDEKIAELMSCDPSTVRRNKSRLVGRLAVFLYGAAAVV